MLDIQSAGLWRGVDLDVDVELGGAIAWVVGVTHRHIEADLVFVGCATFDIVNRLRVQIKLICTGGRVHQQHAVRRVQGLVCHCLAGQRTDTIGRAVNYRIQQLVAVFACAGGQIAFNGPEQIGAGVVGYVNIDILDHEREVHHRAFDADVEPITQFVGRGNGFAGLRDGVAAVAIERAA